MQNNFENKVEYLTDRNFLSVPFDFKNKKNAIALYNKEDINTLCDSFKIEYLPEYLQKHEREIKLQLLTNGFTVFTTEATGELLCFVGGLGGAPNVFYEPTISNIANAALNWSGTVTIEDEKDAVLINNDSLRLGFIPMLTKFNTIIVEIEISMINALQLTRMMEMIKAKDGKAKAAADIYIKNIENGKISSVVDEGFFEDQDIQIQEGAKNIGNVMTQLIEQHVYWTGRKLEFMGLSAPTNAKREALNDGEAQLGQDMTRTKIDDVIDCWTIGFNKVNERYNENIKVSFNGVLRENDVTRLVELEKVADESGLDLDMEEMTDDETIDEVIEEKPEEEIIEETEETNEEGNEETVENYEEKEDEKEKEED